MKWTMKMDITDPKKKAQMAEAEKKMNDPATQAQMKEMQAKMNDPAFKAQMDANPQMKAQMEAVMKGMQAMQSGGGAASMMPKGMTMKIKGGNTLMLMDGGMMSGNEMLHLKDKTQTVRLDRANKTFTIMSGAQAANAGATKTPDVKFTKTSETTKILGYNCTKYLADMKEPNGSTMTQIFWTTTDIKDVDFKSLAKQRIGPGGRSMLPEGIEGVPMRIEMATPEGKMIMEVAEIKRETLNASDFTIPSDFKETKMTGRGF